MDIKLAKRAWVAQKHAAYHRGILFKFSFESWCRWWHAQLGPDWQDKRGCHRGQFAMARRGDKGPYAPHNVKCILSTDNQKETVKNGTSNAGEKHGCVKLTEQQVIAIRATKAPLNVLSKQYGVHKDTIRYIKNGTLWSYLKTPVVPFVPLKATHPRLSRKQVIEIYTSSKSPNELAPLYEVTSDNIRCIKRGSTWRHITARLSPFPS